MPVSTPAPASTTRRRATRLLGSFVAAAALVLPLSTTPPAEAAGFSLVVQDQFAGTRINGSYWGVYNGGNGGDRVAANTIVKDGKLILRNRKIDGVWKGAGVSMARANKQKYGKYEMRVRFDRGYGVRVASLLWPADGGWPPEVDFYEIPADSPNRTVNTLTNHYGTKANHRMHHDRYAGDFTQWHTVGVEWTPGKLVYTLDGRAMRTMTKDVPAEPMWLGIQTRPGSDSGARPNSTTPSVVDLEVDWVKVYKYQG